MSISLQSLARKAAFAQLVKACEARVATRQWTSAPIWSPEPLYFERNQYSRGRKLEAKPSKSKDCMQYGFDADGAVVRLRDWSGFLGQWSEEELFTPFGPGVVGLGEAAKGHARLPCLCHQRRRIRLGVIPCPRVETQ